MKIESRTFIISGGCSGLGLSTALHLLSHGANVSLLDLQPPPTEPPTYASVPISPDTFSLLSQSSRTLYTQTDVASSSSIASAISATTTWVSSSSSSSSSTSLLGGVICCAGVSIPSLALPRSAPMPMASFDKVLNINLRGTVDLIVQTLPHLASISDSDLETADPSAASDDERGIVIVVSSVAAYDGQVGQLSYSASKGAIASMVLPLARELGAKCGVRVVGVAPGLFESGMTFPPKKTKKAGKDTDKKTHDDDAEKEKEDKPTRGFNPGMIEYPMRLGRGEEFAKLVGSIVENPMINGSVIRLDGAVRMPSRL